MAGKVTDADCRFWYDEAHKYNGKFHEALEVLRQLVGGKPTSQLRQRALELMGNWK